MYSTMLFLALAAAPAQTDKPADPATKSRTETISPEQKGGNKKSLTSPPRNWGLKGEMADNTWIGHFDRKDYAGLTYKSATNKSKDHHAVMVVSQNATDAERAIKAELGKMRESAKTGFRLLYRPSDVVYIAIQGDFPQDLSDDDTLLARGEVAKSFAELLKWAELPPGGEYELSFKAGSGSTDK